MAKIKVLVEIIEEKCGECVYSQLNPDYAACNYHGAAEERSLSPYEDPNDKYSYFIPDWCPLSNLIEIPSVRPYTRDELDFLHDNPRLIVRSIELARQKKTDGESMEEKPDCNFLGSNGIDCRMKQPSGGSMSGTCDGYGCIFMKMDRISSLTNHIVLTQGKKE